MAEFEVFGAAEKVGWSSRDVANTYVAHFTDASDQAMEGMLEAVAPKPGTTVLDLCCGHGSMTARLCDIGCDVTGLDFSKAMLSHAEKLAPQASLKEADAQDLPFEDESFDAVVCNFGIMHLPDQPRALSEVRRVLKPGGTFGMTVWFGPDASPSFKIAFGALMAHADPSKGAPPQPDFFQFARREVAEEMLGGAGFRDINHAKINCFWHLEAADQLFKIYAEATVRMAMILSAQSDQDVEAVKKAMTDEVAAGYGSNGGYLVPIPAALITGKV